jgi:hypothetical protein
VIEKNTVIDNKGKILYGIDFDVAVPSKGDTARLIVVRTCP